MTIRSLILGFALALFITGVTFFNDWVVTQTHLVGNHLPIGVFGVVVLMLMVINPLISLIRPSWVLKPAELAIITAMGLVVCGWAGSNFSRTYISNMALPGADYRGQAAWQSTQIMSYLPDGSSEVAAGHVADWDKLVTSLNPESDNALEALSGRLDEEQTRRIVRIAGKQRRSTGDERLILRMLNEVAIHPVGAEGDALQPLYISNAAAAKWISERKSVEATLAGLQAERAKIEASLQEKQSGIATELQKLQSSLENAQENLQSSRIEQEALRLKESSGEGLSDDEKQRLTALTTTIAELETQEQSAQQSLRDIKRPLAPTERELANVDWRISHYTQQLDVLAGKANRATLVAMLPETILPAPAGRGALLNHGKVSAFATDKLVQGWDGADPLRVKDIPWWTWWPTLMTWGGIAILLTVGIFCLATIVHPQWSQRELLSYPIVRFIGEITEPGETAGLPRVMTSKLFWIAFTMVLTIHFINGMATWYPEALMEIPLNFDFSGAKKLAPNMAKASNSHGVFTPTLFFSALGFAFFLNKEISFSVGISAFLWCFFAGFLIQSGVPVTDELYGSGISQMLRFGAYTGLALMIAYTGRRYYLDVLTSAFGKPRQESTPLYTIWAARGMIASLIGCGVMMNLFLGLDWLLCILFIACVLIMSIGMARVNVESGLFFFQPWWMPVGVITAFFGVSAIGPEAILALAIASAVIMNDPRESAMPFFSNALGLSDRVSKSSIGKTMPVLIMLIVVGFGVMITATLYWQYTNGVAITDGWARTISRNPLNETAKGINDLAARGELTASNMRSGLERLGVASPDSGAMMWGAVGLGLVLATAFARLRLPWWPLHPLVFLIWGNYASSRFAFSFLLGWIVKVLVTKFGGAKGYRAALPFMVGMIAGELLAIFGWMLVGWLYYGANGTPPEVYRILPG